MRKLLCAVALAAATCAALVVSGEPANAGTQITSAATRMTAVAPNCGTAIYKTNGAPWTCTFDDEFNGTALNTSKWLPITTSMNSQSAAGGCFVNSPNNISVANGVLSLTTRKEAAPFTCKTQTSSFQTQISSSQIATYGHFYQTYGRFEVRAKFPATTLAGLQSSLWMWPENNVATGTTGEVDIAEWYSFYPNHAIPTLHYAYGTTTVNLTSNINVTTNYNCALNDTSQFHTYTVTWLANTFKIDYDGVNCLTDYAIPLGVSPFNQPFFVALGQGLGVGKNAYVAGTTPLPATTQVDYVRAWK